MGPYIGGASRYILAAAIMPFIMSMRKEAILMRHLKTYLILGIVGVFGFKVFLTFIRKFLHINQSNTYQAFFS
jgi:hypothetical protein